MRSREALEPLDRLAMRARSVPWTTMLVLGARCPSMMGSVQTPSPALSMLWESDDPEVVLRRRFGFSDGTAAASWVADVLRDRWGIEAETCERIVMSDRNALAWVRVGSDRFVAKWSVAEERFDRLRTLADVVAWLDVQGQPVSAPLPALDGCNQIEVEGRSVGLQQEIAGAPLSADRLDDVHAVGAALASLHAALRRQPIAVAGLEPSAIVLSSRLRAWLDAAPSDLDEEALRALRRDADTLPEPASPQLVHGDVRAANVIWADDAVAAFLDFEDARLDLRVVELARAAVLLGTEFHEWGPVPPAAHDALRAGYESVERLTDAEAAWWPALLLWLTLAFVPAGSDPTGWGASARALRDRLRARR